MWTADTKGSRLLSGVESNGRITEQTRLETLSKEDGKNLFTRTVYMEANGLVVGSVTLQAMPVLGTSAVTGSDTAKYTSFTFDVDMNTDNFDGTSISSSPTMPDRNAREELYEKHEYGLGIVMLTDEPMTVGTIEPQLFYPMVVEVAVAATTLPSSISFDHIASSEPGGILLYKLVGNVGYELLQTGTAYTLEHLGFTDMSGTITLYVAPQNKHDVVSEWYNPFQHNTKPTSEITVTFSYGSFSIEENIRYIVSSNASFWNNYLLAPAIRSAFAAKGVYGNDGDTVAAHATPTSYDLPNFALQLMGAGDLTAMGFNAATAALIGSNNANGFNACVYYDHITGNAILAFQGSDPLALAKPVFVSSGLFTQDEIDSWSDWYLMWKLGADAKIGDALARLNTGVITGSSAGDWICNTAQSNGKQTPQYDTAMNIAYNLPKNFVSVNDATSIAKITAWTITGHSLGGGLASAAAGVCGNLSGPQVNGRVDTFNAAGLHTNTVTRFLSGVAIAPHAITAYRTESDELTEGQAYGYLPQAVGTPYWLEDFADDSTNALSSDWPGHTMKSVLQGLLVDRIGRQLGVLYIIDSTDDVCLRGNHNQSTSGTTRIATTPYAF
jgi:hypothetical protein